MANGTTHVQPGDLITSDLWNGLRDQLADALQRLATLEGTSGTGTEIVPNFFGHTLGQARAILNQPSMHLNLGRVLDTFGAVVVPGLPAVQSRVVLGQIPQPGDRAVAGALVDLVIAAAGAGGGPVTPTTPTITGFNQSETAILQPVVILGSNFDVTPANNQVTFANVPTPQPPTSQSTPGSLFVRVPDGIPGAPTSPGASLDVQVRVTTPTGSATATHRIVPALAAPVPAITSIDTSPNPSGVVNELLTIHGQNFSPTASTNVVFFGSTPATPVSATTDQLVVRVPASLPSLPNPHSFAFFNVFVEVDGVASDPVTPPLMIQRP